MHTQEGRPVRYIAEALGVPKSTAADWVKAGREAEEYIGLLDRAETRLRHSVTLRACQAWLVEEFTGGGSRAVEMVPVLVRVLEREAKLLGLDAPTRVAVSDDREPPAIDPKLVAEVREATARTARRRLELEGEQ